jgi:hypothetical protein
MSRLPFSKPVVWYPTLGILALEELVELPIVTAVVLGRLVMAGRARRPDETGEGSVVGPVVGH